MIWGKLTKYLVKIQKISLLVLFFAVFSLQGRAQKLDTVRTYFQNGQLRSVGSINEDSVKQGAWTFYFPNGHLNAEEQYKDGILNGIIKYYDTLGNMHALEYRVNGLLDGKAEYYHANGTLQKSGYFKEGVATGHWQYFFPDGSLETNGFFENGKATGYWTFYDKDGKVRQKGPMKSGKEEGEWRFYENGKLQFIGHYKAGKKVAPWYSVKPNGKKKELSLD